MLATTVSTGLYRWLPFVLAAGFAWRLSRGGGGSAVSELSKANEVLTRRVQELGDEVRDLRVENASLKSRTDYQASIGPLVDQIGKLTELIAVRLLTGNEKTIGEMVTEVHGKASLEDQHAREGR